MRSILDSVDERGMTKQPGRSPGLADLRLQAIYDGSEHAPLATTYLGPGVAPEPS